MRIGNYVSFQNWSPYRIEAVDLHHCHYHPEAYEPIELSEDILLSLGFVCDRFQYNYETDNFIFSMMFHDAWNIHYKEKVKHIGDEINLSGFWKVHQLQNLYFALTGEELDFKI